MCLPTITSRAILDPDDRLIIDAYCIKCGHALRNEAFRGRCPGCNHSISDSVHGDFLIDAERGHVLNLAAGVGLLIYPVYVLAGIVTLAALVALLGRPGLLYKVSDLFIVTLFGALLSPLLSVMGMLSVTRRKRMPYYFARYGNRRDVTMFSLLAVLLCGGTIAALYYALQITLNVLLVLWFAVPGVVFLYGLGRLMMLVPDKRMAGRCSAAVLLLGVLSAAALAVLEMTPFIQKSHDLETGYVVLSILSVGGGFGLAIFVSYLLRDVRVTLLRAAH